MMICLKSVGSTSKMRSSAGDAPEISYSRETPPDNYCYAEDKEGGADFGPQYAPQLLIHYL